MGKDGKGAVAGEAELEGAPGTKPVAGEGTDGESTGGASSPALTLDAIQAAMERLLGDRDQRLLRAVQSQMDRRDNSMWKRLQSSRATAKRAADQAKRLGLVDDAGMQKLAAGLVDQAWDEALDEAEESDEETPPAAFSGSGDPQGVTQHGQALAQRFGLTGDDPEAAAIIVDGTAEEYRDSIIVAGTQRMFRALLESLSGGDEEDDGESGEDEGGEEEDGETPNAKRLARAPATGGTGKGSPKQAWQDETNVGELYKTGLAETGHKRRTR